MDEWVRHFRKAKQPETLDRMMCRSLEHRPREEVVIRGAAEHRLNELLTGRLLEVVSE